MKNSQEESLSVHTLDTWSSPTRWVFCGCGGLRPCDVDRLVQLAIYHDCSEIITGDMPTPIKYYNPEIKRAYKDVEDVANERLADIAPPELRADYAALLDHKNEDPELLRLLKAADKLSALVKCVEEENSGSREFSRAKESILASITEMGLPEADAFIAECLPSYGLTLDELG